MGKAREIEYTMKKRKRKKTNAKISNRKSDRVSIISDAYNEQQNQHKLFNAPVYILGASISVKGKIGLLLAFVAYLAVSVGFFGIPIIGHLKSFYVGQGADPFADMWGLYWWPYAVAHGLNLFVTHAIWAPDGFNLTWANLVPGAALLISPITLTLGPVAAHNLLYILAPALAAGTTYILVYHITRSFWPSLIAGYLFGFSSYEVGQMLGHLVLVLIFLIPLGTYLVLLKIEGRMKTGIFIALMATILTFQFLFSVEIFATMTIFGGLVLGCGLIISKKHRKEVMSAGLSVAASYILTLVLVSPYLYYMLAHGYPKTPINSPSVFSTDLLNFLLPTPVTLIGHGTFEAITAKFTGDWAENGGYIGLPLLIIIFHYVLTHWRSKICKLLSFSLFIIIVATLGPTLHVAGVDKISLPWTVFSRMPLLKNALPVRFMAFGSLIIAIIVGIWLSDQTINNRIKWVLVPLSIVFLLPNIPSGMWKSDITVPPFFSQGLYKKYIMRGENVLIIPYGQNGASALWQIETDMYFRMPGGYIGFTPPSFTSWPIVNTFYSGKLISDYPIQLKYFLGSHGVGAVILENPSLKSFSQLFYSLGILPINVGGVAVFQVPSEILSEYQNTTPADAAAQADFNEFSTLYLAAGRFLAGGGSEGDIYPLALENRGYLPNYYGGYKRSDPQWNWTSSQGWVGVWGNNIAVGVVGSGDEIIPIINEYRKRATQIFFPYPTQVTSVPDKNTSGQLLMVFSKRQIISDAIGAESSHNLGAFGR